MMSETGACVPCTRGLYCVGGDRKNPNSTSTACPAGLATRIVGAKSQAQVRTAQLTEPEATMQWPSAAVLHKRRSRQH